MLKQDAVLKLLESMQAVRELELSTPDEFAQADAEQIAVLQGEIGKWESKRELMADDVDIVAMIDGKIAVLHERLDALRAKDYVKMAQTSNFDTLYDLAEELAEELGFADAPVVDSAQTVKRRMKWSVVNDRVYHPTDKHEITGFTVAGMTDIGARTAVAGWSLPAGHPMRIDAWLVGYQADGTFFVKGAVSSNVDSNITSVNKLINRADVIWGTDSRTGLNRTPFQTGNYNGGEFVSSDVTSKWEILDVRG